MQPFVLILVKPVQFKKEKSMEKIVRLGYSATAIFLGLLFFTAGMGKLYANHQFFGLMGPVWLEEKLVQFDLGMYARFIAYCQVLIGYLLITTRFRTIGSIIVLPMILNILMITISQNWTGTPYVVSVFLIQNIYLLWYKRNELIHLITGEVVANIQLQKRSIWGSLLWLSGFSLLVISVHISFIHVITAWTFALVGLAVGIFTQKIELRLFKS